MIRNLKVLGLALVAVFAMSAMAATAAMAEDGKLTSVEGTYPLHLDGEDLGNPAFTPEIGQEITCETAKYTGTELSAASSTVQVTPEYENCKQGERTTTVTHNGCEYTFHTGTAIEEGTYPVTADLHCPEGEQLEIHTYNDEAHTNTYCTATVDDQTEISGNLVAHNENETTDIRLTGDVEPDVTTHGSCSFNLTLTIGSVLHVDATIEGTDKLGNPNPIHIG